MEATAGESRNDTTGPTPQALLLRHETKTDDLSFLKNPLGPGGQVVPEGVFLGGEENAEQC